MYLVSRGGHNVQMNTPLATIRSYDDLIAAPHGKDINDTLRGDAA